MNRAIFVIALTPSDALLELLKDPNATRAERLDAISREVKQPDTNVFDCVTAEYKDDELADAIERYDTSFEFAVIRLDGELIRELHMQSLAYIQAKEIQRRATTAAESPEQH